MTNQYETGISNLTNLYKNEDWFTYRENLVEHASSNIVFLTSLSVDGTRDISRSQT